MVLKRIFSKLIILPPLTFFACSQGSNSPMGTPNNARFTNKIFNQKPWTPAIESMHQVPEISETPQYLITNPSI